MLILEENRQKFEYCRIPEWHKAGYTGQGLKIAVMEGGTHGYQVENTLWQTLPKTQIEHRRRPGVRINNGTLTPDSKEKLARFYKEIYKDGFHIITHSLGGRNTPEKELLLDDIILGNNLIFTTSAGNTGREITSKRASYMAQTFSVGACDINRFSNELERKEYSSIGDKIDVYGFAGLYTTRNFEKENPQCGGYFRGTSCANPFFTGVLGLWMQWRFEKGLPAPDYKAIQWFVEFNGERIDEWGKLAKLPSVREAEFSAIDNKVAQEKLEHSKGMRDRVRSKEEILSNWNMSEAEASTSATLYEGWWY